MTSLHGVTTSGIQLYTGGGTITLNGVLRRPTEPSLLPAMRRWRRGGGNANGGTDAMTS
jgi:hypothetical protein